MAASTTSRLAFDLIVVGGGSGGVRCARISAGHGAKVALVETSFKHGPPSYTAIGGTCVNVGCVPKKLFVIGSHFAADAKLSEAYGWKKHDEQQKVHEWKTMIAAKNTEITRLNGAYAKILGNSPKNGGSMNVIEGTGSLLDKETVQVTTASGEKQILTAPRILICVGGWPHVPRELLGREHVITSNEAFYLPDRPKRVLIVGGGYIAVEFACIFHGLGSHVIQMYRGDLFMRGFDDDVRKHLFKEMQKKAIDVRFKENPAKVEKLASGEYRVTTEAGTVVEVDCVMYATGRQPKLEGLGLDKLGVKIGAKNQILVNDLNETNVPGIYAVGDCIERMCLTPVALREGHLLADRLFAKSTRVVNYENIPSAVFSQPEIGTCGLTEEQAVAKYQNITVYTAEFKPMKYTMIPDAKERYYFKLIVEDKTRKVVGIHAVMDGAGEMIQGFAVAMQAGATKEQFDDTIGIHPTSAEEFVTMRTPSYRYVGGMKSPL